MPGQHKTSVLHSGLVAFWEYMPEFPRFTMEHRAHETFRVCQNIIIS